MYLLPIHILMSLADLSGLFRRRRSRRLPQLFFSGSNVRWSVVAFVVCRPNRKLNAYVGGLWGAAYAQPTNPPTG